MLENKTCVHLTNMEEIYLYKHDNTFAQNLANRSFVVIVALKNFLFQELSCSQMKRFIWPVEPAAIQPLLTCIYYRWKKLVLIRKTVLLNWKIN